MARGGGITISFHIFLVGGGSFLVGGKMIQLILLVVD